MTVSSKEEVIHSTTASFSNFDAVGLGEIDNIKAAKELADKNYYGNPQQANKNGLDDLAVDMALDTWRDMHTRQLEKLTRNGDMYQFGDYEFTKADFDEALHQNKDKYMASMNEADATEFAMLFEQYNSGLLTPDQELQVMERLNQLAPDLAKDAQENNVIIDNSKKSSIENSIESSRLDAKEAELNSIERPESVITQKFTEEVAGVGANAKSFTPLDQSIEIAQVADKSATQYVHTEKPFVLDM